MIAYLINIGLLVLWAVILLFNKPSPRKKKIFIIIAALQWILLSGLRHISIGADTYAYSIAFDSIRYQSWQQIFDRFFSVLFLGASGKDPGYAVFEKFIQLFTINYQIYLIIIAIIFTGTLGVFVYRNSREPLISFFIYSCLFYSFYAITGHRQTIATALIVLIGYEFIKQKRLIPFLLISLVAFTIHKSAIIFIPFYFIANQRITRKYLITILVIGTGLLLMGKLFYAPIAKFIGYESFIGNEIGGTGTFALMMVFLAAIAFWRMKIILKNNSQSVHFFNALIMALFFTLMTLENQSFMRAQQYYSLFIMLLVPEMILSFQKRERIFALFIASAALLILFIRTNPQYLFFWQG